MVTTFADAKRSDEDRQKSIQAVRDALGQLRHYDPAMAEIGLSAFKELVNEF